MKDSNSATERETNQLYIKRYIVLLRNYVTRNKVVVWKIKSHLDELTLIMNLAFKVSTII